MHQPVLVAEVLDYLAPTDGGIYVDGNLGLGGHSKKILERCKPSGRVIGFDLDASAIAIAKERLAFFGDRLISVHRNFATLKESLSELGVSAIDGLLLDLGLSSLQLAAGGRGFSFRGGGPLDMRMDARAGETAADLINKASEEELADILFYYGEERQARRIARFLVEERAGHRIETTDQLVRIIERAVPGRYRPKKIHVATKTFQALRIAVNRELNNLQEILEDGPGLLKPGGRFCIISFHSLEDRMVKRSFLGNPKLRVLTKKPVVPGEQERRENPRSSSAKLRVAEVGI